MLVGAKKCRTNTGCILFSDINHSKISNMTNPIRTEEELQAIRLKQGLPVYVYYNKVLLYKFSYLAGALFFSLGFPRERKRSRPTIRVYRLLMWRSTLNKGGYLLKQIGT